MKNEVHELLNALEFNIGFLNSLFKDGCVLFTKKQFADEYRGYNLAIEVLRESGGEVYPYVVPMMKKSFRCDLSSDDTLQGVVLKDYRAGYDLAITHTVQFLKKQHKKIDK